MTEKKYITTTLPYANSTPHVGHMFEFIIGDALSRYYKNKLGDENVYFNIGLDEHGLKIQQAAEKENIETQEFLDNLCFKWKRFCNAFHIKHDNFYRTSHKNHKEKVQKFWLDQVKRDNIYKKTYSGLYCVGCESFKTEKDIIDNKCPDHQNLDLKPVEEENYFFKLSKFREELVNWINVKGESFLSPQKKLPELYNFLENIDDISISRNSSLVKWGVEVPGDESQTIYVWFDALCNYVFAVGLYEDQNMFEEQYNKSEVIQICGPDNLKFQAGIWQGLLASADLKRTDKLIVHGTILDKEGKKMSKTVGNVVDPIDQLNKFGVDVVRLYSLVGLHTFENSSWDEDRLKEIYNSYLCDNFGNLITRILHLIDIKNIEIDESLVLEREFFKAFKTNLDSIKSKFEETYNFFDYINSINISIKDANAYISLEKPWEEKEDYNKVLIELYLFLKDVNELYYPIIPKKYEEVKKALESKKKQIVFEKII